MKKQKPGTNTLNNLIIIAILLIGYSVYYFTMHKTPIQYDFTDTSVTIYGRNPVAFATELPYEDILSVELASEFDPGTCIQGTEDKYILYGKWENESLGEYTLYAWASVTEYIILDTAEHGIIVCNYESNDATMHLAPALQELLDSKKED